MNACTLHLHAAASDFFVLLSHGMSASESGPSAPASSESSPSGAVHPPLRRGAPSLTANMPEADAESRARRARWWSASRYVAVIEFRLPPANAASTVSRSNPKPSSSASASWSTCQKQHGLAPATDGCSADMVTRAPRIRGCRCPQAARLPYRRPCRWQRDGPRRPLRLPAPRDARRPPTSSLGSWGCPDTTSRSRSASAEPRRHQCRRERGITCSMTEMRSCSSVDSSAQPGALVGRRARMIARSMSLCVCQDKWRSQPQPQLRRSCGLIDAPCPCTASAQ